jgi:hypothetical protein
MSTGPFCNHGMRRRNCSRRPDLRSCAASTCFQRRETPESKSAGPSSQKETDYLTHIDGSLCLAGAGVRLGTLIG